MGPEHQNILIITGFSVARAARLRRGAGAAAAAGDAEHRAGVVFFFDRVIRLLSCYQFVDGTMIGYATRTQDKPNWARFLQCWRGLYVLLLSEEG